MCNVYCIILIYKIKIMNLSINFCVNLKLVRFEIINEHTSINTI